MSGSKRVLFGMLPRRTVATSYVTTFRASPKMQPPAIRQQALFTAGSSRFYMGIDAFNLPHEWKTSRAKCESM
jgi:hypothetical protein